MNFCLKVTGEKTPESLVSSVSQQLQKTSADFGLLLKLLLTYLYCTIIMSYIKSDWYS